MKYEPGKKVKHILTGELLLLLPTDGYRVTLIPQIRVRTTDYKELWLDACEVEELDFGH
jgi:hypothetical protein